jgi:hypothetical protein
MNTANRARIARKRAQRVGLRLTQRGTVYTIQDADNITLAVGQLVVVDAYLLTRCKPKPRGRSEVPTHPNRGGATLATTFSRWPQRDSGRRPSDTGIRYSAWPHAA